MLYVIIIVSSVKRTLSRISFPLIKNILKNLIKALEMPFPKRRRAMGTVVDSFVNFEIMVGLVVNADFGSFTFNVSER